MTGFGRSHINRDGREMFMELKSVNHRFLDVNYRILKPLSFLEEPLRAWIRQSDIKRGHLDVSVSYRNTRADSKTVLINRELVLACAQETQSLALQLTAEAPSVFELIKLCDALTVTEAEENADEVINLAQEAFLGAAMQLQAMRETEGNALRVDLRQNLNAAMEAVERIAQLAPEVPAEYREKLQKRLKEWQADAIDPARIAQEVALMADRCAIDEELSRLYSHFHQFALCLDQQDEAGRRMDFLLQEMNREVNTIGSKAANAQIAGNVVELKSVLEKLREQVQNIE
jgi:uncharacterized protein (TIGR00255 family)